MTAARARSAIGAKLNGETSLRRLEGIIPVFEDWHSKANFMGVGLLQRAMCTWSIIIFTMLFSCRFYGNTTSQISQLLNTAHYFS